MDRCEGVEGVWGLGGACYRDGWVGLTARVWPGRLMSPWLGACCSVRWTDYMLLRRAIDNERVSRGPKLWSCLSGGDGDRMR